MNVVILIGRLTRDPELRTLQGGASVCNFSIAVDRDFRSKDGEKQTDFFNVQAWNKTGESVANFVTKGRLVAVNGMIQNRSWETDSGERRTATEIVANNVKFLDYGKSDSMDDAYKPEDAPSGYKAIDDDVPF